MKKFALPILIAVLLSLLACSIGYEGINWGVDEDVEKIYSLTETASAPGYEPITSGGIPVNRVDEPEEPPEPAPEPAPVTAPPAPSSEVNLTGDQAEYSVTGTNNGCTCSVSGSNMTLALDIQDDKLFFNLPDGTSNEYTKVGPDTYKRSYMGYYINVDTSSGEETRVDEERHDVITLTEDGFISEHYQGTEGSPCCFHTYTNVEKAP